MGSLRVAIAVLVGVLLILPSVAAEDDGPAVRAKPGKPGKKAESQLERYARIMMADDEAAFDVILEPLEELSGAELKELMTHVRRLARTRSRAHKAGARLPWTDTDRAVISVETHILEAERGALQGIGQRGGDNVRFLDDTAVEVILRAAKKGDKIKVLSAPRLSAYDGQSANISTINQISYIQDYAVETGNTTTISDPIIGVVQEGLVLDLKPVLSKDGKYVTVELNGTWSKVQRPIPELEVGLLDGSPKVKIQLPEVTTSRMRANATMPDGAAALVGGGPLFERDGKAYQRLVLLRVHKVDLPKKEEGK